ncbi:Multicopper oxidase mco [Streptomyces sp. ADI96-15]|uniref:multicopper oxidase family protein n=1 Tax=Streptomyces TaxID=1883 RepID=UPI0003C2BFDC|nr:MULTISPECIES: multicopper oxidase domain-containing protein [Streptomyces]QOZ99022.1 copper oxidase [Streptomyces violascens]ESP99526.1 multicopper oxidase, type 1, CueO [Streptomyces sp. GBA 94-10 4N24]ESQ05574.1 multicopper oxidase, type 1, CueO [Streptomyces sp. PVA_94-07]RPK59404.1 Multicopper oxidase mco [Streptomyces sp. ADI96-15]RWZ77702.1 multicopper oxidase family protein [Streptomyces albidoflavus]
MGGLGAGGALAGLGWAYADGGPLVADGKPPRAPADEGAPLRDLPEVRSREGRPEHTLTVATTRPVVGGRRLHLDTYNGQLPGALLRIRPGDRLRILLRNRMLPSGVPLNALPPLCADKAADGTEHAHSAAGGPLHCAPEAGHQVVDGHTIIQQALATNLHTHGLQVSPSGSADNVFVRLDPLEDHQYAYDIPFDHPAGLHWYHPHHHGSTTHQAWSGLAGPIVVEGDIDHVPEIAGMRERTIVLSMLRLDGNGENPTAVVLPTGGDDPFTTVPAVPTRMVATLNGQLRPEVTLRPGETQRWRVLNAAPHRSMWLHVERHSLHQTGQDGIPFARTRTVRAIMMASANRAEFVIQGGAPGRYRIYAAGYDQGHPGGVRPDIELGTLVVTGRETTGRIPRQLVEPPRMPRLPVARRRTLVFSGDISGKHGLGVRFLIDGKLYDVDRIDQEVQAGTVEEWRIVNEDVFQHPLHIHVNPFQVIDVKGIPPRDTSWQTDPGIWWDTFRLPPDGEFTLRTYFRPDITGKTVFHCHILPHEDNGMMGNLLISPKGGAR